LHTKAAGDNPEEGFFFGLNDVELFDADGDASTKLDRISMDGSFSFKPSVQFDLVIDGFSVEQLSFDIASEQQASVRVVAAREATFSENYQLDVIELPPITFSIGPLPVVLVPRLTLEVGVDGTVTAELTAGAAASTSTRVGFGYRNGSWEPVAELEPLAEFDVPGFRDGAKGQAKVWASVPTEACPAS
jgi:hypothetical protein